MSEPYRLFGNLPSIWCEDSKSDQQYLECPMYEQFLKIKELKEEYEELIEGLQALLGEEPKTPRTTTEIIKDMDEKILKKLLHV